ncbi:DUF397 domain-containing protein [Saccharothrix coeruleofusca]|uniref:DUF397 domain-containing protein n=1 Tax=Saccharothrix coeruleofusca TaxID=33919 RepID=UPI001AEAD181|nr:DUF397 domain-containing protein [Saccharothrix coeruleofusca]
MTGFPLVWRKAGRSGENGNSCVELAWPGGRLAVRDSKNPDGPVLAWTPAAVGAFFAAVRSGRLG